MPLTKLDEPNVTLRNVCPQGHTEESIYTDGEVDVAAPLNSHLRDAFAIDVRWSAGAEEERLTLLPGEEKVIGQSIGASLGKAHGHEGLAVIRPRSPKSTEDPKLHELRQVERALQEAERFYRTHGRTALSKKARKLGLSDHDLARSRSEFVAYHLNEKKAVLIERELAKMRKEIKELQFQASRAKGAEKPKEAGATA